MRRPLTPLGVPAVAVVLVGVVGLVSGCSGAPDREVESVTEEFYAAVGSGDGSAACALLAPRARAELEQSSGQPCETAVLEEAGAVDGPVGTAEVFGTLARVNYGTDTVFLTRFESGWKVAASGCTPAGDEVPYDCRVKVG